MSGDKKEKNSYLIQWFTSGVGLWYEPLDILHHFGIQLEPWHPTQEGKPRGRTTHFFGS